MRTRDQHEKEKNYIQNLKFIDSKIKKIERDEKNLQRLIDRNFEENRSSNQIKKVSGVMLLSNRMLSKIPVNDTFQQQLSQTLQNMKIKPSELHCSQKVLEEFENLRESIMVYFSLDKYLNERNEELSVANEIKDDISTMQMMYKKAYDHKNYKF